MKPIIMSIEDVRGILDGRKAMARVPVKQSIVDRFVIDTWGELLGSFNDKFGDYPSIDDCPYQPGDALWVRETWQHAYLMDDSDQIIDGTGAYLYAADGDPCFDYWVDPDTGGHKEKMPWKPSIYMPREAARLFLRVTSVRAERVQDISEKDAKREGVCGLCYDAKTGEEKYDMTYFKVIWDARNAKRGYGWDANPFCWVIEFECVEKGEES